MRKIYQNTDANFPRLSTDNFFIDYANSYKFDEITNKTMKFTEDKQLLDADLWATFVEQFKEQPDGSDGGWRGEYWGKMMRGGCFVYSYTKNEKLLEILTATVRDIMTAQDNMGRISSYKVSQEFTGWDIWSRKYVLLGMQYFLEINQDEELKQQVISSMCRQADYLISKIGPSNEGKLPITRTARHWYGLNSSSLLEPIVRLFSITKEEKYLDFAKYIANEGCTYVENIFKLAEKKQLRLYQYPVTKAYEMTSCFEGLLELYRITGEEWYKTAILNFADLILEDDFSVIGSAGCTHELFDHSTVRQANTNNYFTMQETCVTVTLMKFFLQLNLLTGNPKYIDAYEISYYNAYLGAVNTENKTSSYNGEIPDGLTELSPLPFDSYSPLTAGLRGNFIGGLRVMSNNKYYSCCVCIAAAGVGSVPKAALLCYESGLVLNLYINGEICTTTPKGNDIKIITSTAYPVEGTVNITVENKANEEFTLKIRNPYWSKNTTVTQNGNEVSVNEGYIDIVCKDEKEQITLNFDMSTRIIKPIPYGSQVLMNKVIWGNNSLVIPTYDEEDPLAKNNIALQRGPIMLAQDARLGYDLSAPAGIIEENGCAITEKSEACFDTLLALKVKTLNGYITLCDYQSAGKLWNEESKTAVWIKNV